MIGEWNEGTLARFIEKVINEPGVIRQPLQIVAVANDEPADAVIVNGAAMLWRNQTPGSASLNVKAKDSNGTIVRATIALT